MRHKRFALLVLMVLACLGGALSALAAPDSSSPAGRRAAVQARQPARPRAARGTTKRLPAAFSPLPRPAAPAPDEDQCRQACAHAYYFCAAGDDGESCAGGWTSCLADCLPAIGTPTATTLSARLLPEPRE